MNHRRREPSRGVFRLVLPLPLPGLERVNAYLLVSEDGAVLVDCGIFDPDPTNDHGWNDLRAAVEATGARIEDIKILVITHPHIDHYGMAARLLDSIDCELWMHKRCLEELSVYREPDRARRDVQSMLLENGVGREDLDEITAFEDLRIYISRVVEPSRPLAGNEVLEWDDRRWQVVATPGHSPSHICLWDGTQRILISGDHLLPAITPHIDYRPDEVEDPLGDFLASLETVEELGPDLVLPGHGRPFNDGAARARVVARHHDRRLGSILQVVRNQARTANEVTDEIFGNTLLNFHRRLALGEALAHLAYLHKRGEIERIAGDGVVRYRKASRRR